MYYNKQNNVYYVLAASVTNSDGDTADFAYTTTAPKTINITNPYSGGDGGIHGGGRDDRPAPSAPAKTSQGVTSAQHSAFRD